eukprot:3671946-Prymnesium_polylepis.1
MARASGAREVLEKLGGLGHAAGSGGDIPARRLGHLKIDHHLDIVLRHHLHRRRRPAPAALHCRSHRARRKHEGGDQIGREHQGHCRWR